MAAPYDISEREVLLDHTYETQSPPSIMVVRAICSLENVDPREAPIELDFTLYDAIDPEALNELVESGQTQLEVEFSLNKYYVHIERSGRIVIAQ